MKIVPSCAPCLLRRVLATAQRVTDDLWLHDKVLGQVMNAWVEADRDETPAERVTQLNELVCRNLGVADPWQKVRESWVEEVAPHVEGVAGQIAAAEDPLATALAVSARSNAFDDELLTKKALRAELRRLGAGGDSEGIDPLTVSDLKRFRKDLADAETLLFLHDSAPELPFDRLLIEQLVAERPELKITSVVRGQPILLDATLEDWQNAGIGDLPQVVEAVEPGVAGVGVPLEGASREFRERFESSDLVLAKGQAHRETLAESERAVYALLRLKCAVLAREEGGKIGDTLFVRKS